MKHNYRFRIVIKVILKFQDQNVIINKVRVKHEPYL